MTTRPVEGDIALVTRRSGKQYVGIYTLAPGIDYFWASAVPGKSLNLLRDPDVSFEVIGHAISPEMRKLRVELERAQVAIERLTRTLKGNTIRGNVIRNASAS